MSGCAYSGATIIVKVSLSMSPDDLKVPAPYSADSKVYLVRKGFHENCLTLSKKSFNQISSLLQLPELTYRHTCVIHQLEVTVQLFSS